MSVPESAAAVLRGLASREWTLAVAESLTGGLLTAGLVAVPGASRVFRGGVVTYATDSKASVLGVDPALLAQRGPIDPQVAREMADGVRELFTADVGIATTGVAGPEGQGGKSPGHVYVAVSLPSGRQVQCLHLDGDRTAVRESAVDAALHLIMTFLGNESPDVREQY